MNKKIPKIALGAWSWAIAKGTIPIIGVTKVNQVEEAAKAANIVLAENGISQLEKLSDATGVHTLREWEKDMDYHALMEDKNAYDR